MSGKTRPDQEITLPIIGPTSISYLQRCFEMVGRIGLAATFMLVLLLPADSVSVEDGKAIPVQATALLASALAILAGGWNSRSDPLLCALGGAIALWLFITSGMLSGVGNVRSAMHESWVWIAMGLLVFGSRAVFWRGSDRRLLVGWCLIMGVVLSGEAWWQVKVELPELRSSYQADPDRAAREAGIFAPAGSDERKMLEDRINSTEPFATFSLTNSLAGYLLLAIVLVTGLLVRGEAREQPIWTWVTVLCIVLLLASSLLLTKSRTALIAGMLAIGWLVWRQIIGRPHRRRGVPVSWMVTGIVGGSLALVLGFGGFLLGYWDFRVISEAPMSLRFRLDYWRSTAAIVRDYPWFGAGPGNFRSVYSEYRPPEALELVADPHNWILEATAAGGVPLGLFTCGLMFWLGLRLVRDDRAGEDGQNLPVDKATKPSKLDAEATELRDLGNTPGLLQSYLKLWTGWHLDFGMVVGLVIASFWQIYEESTFPIDFYLRSILVCVVLRLLVQPWVRNGRCGRPTVIAAAVGVMIHLLGAGGWSVPGVIFPLAMVVGAHLDAVGKPARDRRWGWQRGVGVAVAFAIVTGYVVSTLVPVRASLHQVVSAQRDFDRGNLPSGLRDLRQAADADPFDPIPCIRGADGAVSGLLELDNGNLRASFEEFLADAAARDPRNQLILRRGGELYLQLYQRWGRAEDLEAAHLWFEKAARRYPTDASLAAQLALIERALGHVDEADQWETKARELDDVNPWRNLSNAYVLDVVQVPRGARIPLQHPAADLLTNH